MQRLIDTHFHLDQYANHADIYNNINTLQQYTLCVTNQPEVFESCMDLYPQTKYVKFALGYNPQLINEVPFSKRSFLNNLSRTNYVGEVGLDFSSRFKTRYSEQIDNFKFICEHSDGKIMSIHCRNAEDQIYNILSEYPNVKKILHWYTGTTECLERFIHLGCYFSINGSMLTKPNQLDLIRVIPQKLILIESDGPHSKIKGRKYNIADLQYIYGLLGDLLQISDVRSMIYHNFNALLAGA